jgi:uncharacterized protein (TIGR03086 family)
MEPVDALASSYDSLERLVRSLGPDDLAAQTPCPEWDVRAVLEHVLGNAEAFVGMARDGKPFAPAEERQRLGTDPATSVRAAADENVAAWRGSDAVDTPTGMIPGVSLFDINLADTVMHTWDIAKATGRDPGVDPEVVDMVLTKMEGEWHEIGHQMGAFGPPCEAAPDAPPYDRLVALTGRQP